MRRVETGDDMEDRVDSLGRRERSPIAHTILQRPPRQQLHRDNKRACDFLATEDVDAVRMGDRCGELALAQETGAVLRIRRSVAQEFERDAPALLDVLGFIHRASAATA